MDRQIIAAGGGGFRMEPENLALDRYYLAQCRKKRPSVCFIPTASAESLVYTLAFFDSYNTLDCVPSCLSLFRQPTADLESYLLEKDIIHVGGGNTRSMLALWREWNLDKILYKAWLNGVILTGVSAGCICWFEQGVTDSVPNNLTAMDCLGFLEGSCCPHYDGEVNRRPSTHAMLLNNELSPGYGLDNGVALHFIGTELVAAVSSRPDANAYSYAANGAQVIETPLSVRYLEELTH